MKNVKKHPTKESTKGSSEVAIPKLKTPNDLGNEAASHIAKVVNPLIADAFSLFVKTKNFHWHLAGSHYRDYHLLFDEQASQIFDMVDVLAERVRKLGGTTIRSIGHIERLKAVQDDDDEFVEAKEMVRRLMDDNKSFASKMREAHKVCSKYNDVATTSILENFIDETEKRTWFLFSTQA
ncbi:MAG: DNA starvation/stationary phase protection protein [Gammaproteobacteria bacterium 39-13]|nr:DNA starvation/stationary phase protection protein [Gammaproteobacteria bacterium]OJV90003.1 MAG: DNA starvation/stationary phase protection protein [Gammaproteobacteria bacterium 39-13]